MRTSGGVDAAMASELAAGGVRIVRRSDHGTASRSNQTGTWHLGRQKRFVLEKDQPDQCNDRDPGDRIRDDNAVPESAVGRIALFRRAPVPHVRRPSMPPWKTFP